MTNAIKPEVNDKLMQVLAELPDSPGVYIMRDGEGVIIYVGKATSLKSRVRSYFQSSEKLAPKTRAQMSHVEDLEYVVLRSPMEALILECNLIKQHAPKYNVQLRDDKHYPYLKLTTTEQFPRLLVVRSVGKDRNRYFGPYVSAGAMQVVQKIISNVFPLRTCGNSEFKSRRRPCLNQHIGKCLGPCCGLVTAEDYRQMTEQIALFLDGKTDTIVRDMKQKMEQASAELRFEEAAKYRDRLMAVELVQRQQQMDEGSDSYRDLIAVAAQGDLAVVQMFLVREGKVVGREHFFLKGSAEESPATLLSSFISQYYNTCVTVPPEICLPCALADEAELSEWLGSLRGGRVHFHVPQRGSKARLLQIVEHNAELVLARELEKLSKQQDIEELALLELQQALDLPQAPYRIECYDNSHMQGSYTVSSMVTFCGGLPKKSLYRHFRLQTVADGDDYRAMREVLTRRLRRGLEERQALKEGRLTLDKAPMAQWPDLMLIDGGKGQLAVAVDLLETLQLPIPVAGIAEQFEELYLPHRSEPVILPLNTPAIQLLQRVRDEAHRFAITYHRTLRGKGQVNSVLNEIPGIGPKRRAALLKAFGCLENLKKLSVEELALADGMNKAAAQAVYDYLRQPAQPEKITDEQKNQQEKSEEN